MYILKHHKYTFQITCVTWIHCGQDMQLLQHYKYFVSGILIKHALLICMGLNVNKFTLHVGCPIK